MYQDVPRHRLVEMGQHILGKEPSSWFGPTSAAQAVGHLFETSKEVHHSMASLANTKVHHIETDLNDISKHFFDFK